MIDKKIAVREKGRPREFETTEALQAAKVVFCAEGYEGASLSALTQAMGINPPSLYAAFGSKEGLFLQALDDYHKPFVEWLDQLFAEPRCTLDALTTLITEAARGHAGEKPMKGCLIVNSAIHACRDQVAIANHVRYLVQKNEDMIFARLEQGKRNGDVAQDADSRKLACYVNGLIQGMAVMARAKQSPECVLAIAETGADALRRLLSTNDISVDED